MVQNGELDHYFVSDSGMRRRMKKIEKPTAVTVMKGKHGSVGAKQ